MHLLQVLCDVCLLSIGCGSLFTVFTPDLFSGWLGGVKLHHKLMCKRFMNNAAFLLAHMHTYIVYNIYECIIARPVAAHCLSIYLFL